MSRTREENAADAASEENEQTVLGITFRPMDADERRQLTDDDPHSLVAYYDECVLLLTPSGEIREIDVDGTVHEWTCRKVHGDVDAGRED